MAEEHDSSHNTQAHWPLPYCPTGAALHSSTTPALLNYVGSSSSHTCREKTDHPNEIHMLNSTIIMALSIAERHNLNTWFGRRGKSVWLVCACAMCSWSTAWLPKQHDIYITPSSYYCNNHTFLVPGKGSKRERKRHGDGKLCFDWFFSRFRQTVVPSVRSWLRHSQTQPCLNPQLMYDDDSSVNCTYNNFTNTNG